jgi:hypothetical protein
MNEIPAELQLFRSELLDAIDRDLSRRSPRSPLTNRRSLRVGIPTLAALAAASAAVVIALTLTATSPPSAYAAAKQAVAATAAANSGTITGTVTSNGSIYALDTTQWNGDAIEVTRGDQSDLGPNQALRLIGGTAYVEQSDGTWLRYASEEGVGPKVGPIFELAHNNVQGNTASQILSLATGLTQTNQPNGTTLYSGSIPSSTSDSGNRANDDSILRMITNLSNDNTNPLQLQMTVDSDGFVQQVSLTANNSTTWTITYGKLGSTAPITAPASSTPTAPVVWSPGPACTSPCGG